MLFPAKEVGAFVDEGSDDTRAQIDNLLVEIGDDFQHVVDVFLAFLVEEIEKEFFDGFGSEYFQFMGIFDVHDLVADVVGRLDQIDQRMPVVALAAFAVGE